jgi:hypothetical protein
LYDPSKKSIARFPDKLPARFDSKNGSQHVSAKRLARNHAGSNFGGSATLSPKVDIAALTVELYA